MLRSTWSWRSLIFNRTRSMILTLTLCILITSYPNNTSKLKSRSRRISWNWRLMLCSSAINCLTCSKCKWDSLIWKHWEKSLKLIWIWRRWINGKKLPLLRSQTLSGNCFNLESGWVTSATTTSTTSMSYSPMWGYTLNWFANASFYWVISQLKTQCTSTLNRDRLPSSNKCLDSLSKNQLV